MSKQHNKYPSITCTKLDKPNKVVYEKPLPDLYSRDYYLIPEEIRSLYEHEVIFWSKDAFYQEYHNYVKWRLYLGLDGNEDRIIYPNRYEEKCNIHFYLLQEEYFPDSNAPHATTAMLFNQ